VVSAGPAALRIDAVVDRARLQVAVRLTVEPGERVVLVGPSGAGKSTVLAAVAGLVPLAAGTISHGDRLLSAGSQGRRRAWTRPLHDRRVALVGQQLGLFPHLSVGASIGYGLPGGAKEPIVSELARMLGIDELLAVSCRRLSGGQAQRVALARALAAGPAVLLLDEAFTGLDAALGRRAAQLVGKQVQRDGVPCLLVTHSLVEAQAVGDRIAIIDHGQLLQVDDPHRLLVAPATLEVARIVGYGAVVPAAACRLPVGHRMPPAAASVAVHADQVELWEPRASGPGPATAALPAAWLEGTVVALRPSGPQWTAEVAVGDEQTVPVSVPAGRSGGCGVGDTVVVALAAAPCYDAAGAMVGMLHDAPARDQSSADQSRVGR